MSGIGKLIAVFLICEAVYAFGCLPYHFLAPHFSRTTLSTFESYEPAIPTPKTGPPFVAEAQKVYHFMEFGKLSGKPLSQASQETKTAVLKLLLDGIAQRHLAFQSIGPVQVNEELVFHGRFGTFAVIQKDGSLLLGIRNPEHGRPVRRQEYSAQEMAEFFVLHQKSLHSGRSDSGELSIKPMGEYLEESISAYSQ